MPFLRNCWYVAALAGEVQQGELFNRTLLGESVVMYRKSDGKPVALRNRCPHRFAPLHLGKLDDDQISCHYHGLRFNAAGGCTHNPHGDQRITPGLAIASYPLAERNGFLWIWLGEASRADEALIPNYDVVSKVPLNASASARMLIRANYQLVADNIVDLTHADFVHGPLLSTLGQITKAVPAIESTDRQVSVRWDWKQTPGQGIYIPFLPDPDAETAHFIQAEWNAASSILLIAAAVQGGKDYDAGLKLWHCHLLTPETETTTHYFFVGSRNFDVENAELNQLLIANIVSVFESEDAPLLAEVQQEMATTDLLSLRPAILSCDKGAMHVRRRLATLIRNEIA